MCIRDRVQGARTGHCARARLASRALSGRAYAARPRIAHRDAAGADRSAVEDGRSGPRGVELRQVPLRSALGRAALLPFEAEPQPSRPDRRDHGDGAAARAHPVAQTPRLRRGAGARVLRRARHA